MVLRSDLASFTQQHQTELALGSHQLPEYQTEQAPNRHQLADYQPSAPIQLFPLPSESRGRTVGSGGKEASLERLGIEQVDLYLVHAPPPDIDCRAEVWRGMETCLDNGWTRAIGVSNYGRNHLDALMQNARYGPSVNQVEIHPWLQRPDLIAATLEVGAVPMAYSPLARGHKVEDPKLTKIADAIGCTPAQAALKWCMDRGYITIPKSSNENRIAENLAALEVDIEDQRDALDSLEENYISGWDPTTEP